MKKTNLLIGVCLSLAILSLAVAAASDLTAQEMAKLAKESVTRYPDYEMTAVQAFWGDATFIKQCAPKEGALPDPFVIYVEILADGAMGRSMFEPLSTTAACIRDFTANRSFPKPPEPYMLEIQMSFEP